MYECHCYVCTWECKSHAMLQVASCNITPYANSACCTCAGCKMWCTQSHTMIWIVYSFCLPQYAVSCTCRIHGVCARVRAMRAQWCMTAAMPFKCNMLMSAWCSVLQGVMISATDVWSMGPLYGTYSDDLRDIAWVSPNRATPPSVQAWSYSSSCESAVKPLSKGVWRSLIKPHQVYQHLILHFHQCWM